MAAESAKRLGLGRKSRLTQGRDFARIRRDGQRLAVGCLTINWQRPASAARPCLGVVVGRTIGGAVVRNRARRLLREAFRLHQHGLTGAVELVLVPRPSIAGKKFFDVERDFLVALRKAGLLKEKCGCELGGRKP